MSGGTLSKAVVFSGRVFRMTEKKLYVVLDCVIITLRILDTPFARVSCLFRERAPEKSS